MADFDSSSNDSELIVESAKAKSSSSWIPLILVLLFIPLSSYLLTNFVIIPQLKASLETSDIRAPGGGKRGATSEKVFYHDIAGVVVNVAGTMGTRYLRVSFRVAGDNPSLDTLMRDHRAKVMDLVIATLTVRTIPELEESSGRVALRKALIDAINESVPGAQIEQLYFTEFVIQ